MNTPQWQCNSNDRPFFSFGSCKPSGKWSYLYIFCKLSFCQIVSEMIDFLGSGVRKWISGLILRKGLYELPPCGIEIAQYLLQMRNFFFYFYSFSNEHLGALFQILFSNFLQNKIATFFCHLPDYKNYHTYVLKHFSYEQ